MLKNKIKISRNSAKIYISETGVKLKKGGWCYDTDIIPSKEEVKIF